MQENRKYNYIIWDWNGTIFNDAEFCVAIMNNLLKSRGLPILTIEKYRDVFDFPVKDYYQKLGIDFNKEAFEIVGTEFINEYNNNHYANGKVKIGKRLMERNAIEPESCLLIGDTVHDAEVASELKIDCLLIANGHHSFKKLEQTKVPVLKSVPELENYLFR